MKIICRKPSGRNCIANEKKFPTEPENFLALALAVAQRHQRDTLREVRAAEKIFVAGGHIAQILVGLQVLNVRLHQRRILPYLLVQTVFVRDHAVDHLIHRSRLLRLWCRRRAGDGPGSTQDESEDNLASLRISLSPQ